MRYRLKPPLAYDALRWGYHYTRPVEEFPSLPITEADVFALLVAQKAIAQYAGTPFERLPEASYGKLTGQWSAEDARDGGAAETPGHACPGGGGRTGGTIRRRCMIWGLRWNPETLS